MGRNQKIVIWLLLCFNVISFYLTSIILNSQETQFLGPLNFQKFQTNYYIINVSYVNEVMWHDLGKILLSAHHNINLSWLKQYNNIAISTICFCIYANYVNEEMLHDSTMVLGGFLDITNMKLDSKIAFLNYGNLQFWAKNLLLISLLC